MLLTPNRRLALFLQEEQGKQAYPFHVWTESLWQAIQHDPTNRLLSVVEQWVVWEKIIQEESSEYPLLRTIETAKRVAEGWQLCQQWGISFSELSKACIREDHEFFLRCIKQYTEHCRANHWVDTASLLPILQKELSNRFHFKDPLRLPKTISCIGFNEWTPQEQEFLVHASQSGSTISHSSLLTGKGQTFQYAAPTEAEELISAIQMAKQWLIEHPTARIGILVPNLEQRRFEVERILSETFLVEQFNVSAPLPLSEYPLIQAAFLGLNLGKKDIKFEDLSKMLRLPFYGNYEQEMHSCAVLDVLLREEINQKGLLTDTLPLKGAIVLLDRLQLQLQSQLQSQSQLQLQSKSQLTHGNVINENNRFHLVERLKACEALQSRFSGKHSSETWKTHCLQLLDLLNWPGDRSLDAEEQALQKHWLEVLEQYQSMGRVLGKHNYSEALTQIKRLAAAKLFLPLKFIRTSSIPASIQVLGLLEGLGIPFDFLWVMGLNRKEWPKEPAPNPFIPMLLQRSYNLPRSHADRELQVAKRLTEQLCWGAKTVVFSYAMMIEDQKTTLSPLLGEMAEIPWNSVNKCVNNYSGSNSKNTNCENTKRIRDIVSSGTGSCPSEPVHPWVRIPQKQYPLFSSAPSQPAPSQSAPNQNERPGILQSVIPVPHFHGGQAPAGIQAKKTLYSMDRRFSENDNNKLFPVKKNEIIRGGSRILKLQAACPFRAFADIRLHAKPVQSLRFGLSPALRGEMLHHVLLFFWKGLNGQAALKALTDDERLQRIELAIDSTLQKHSSFWELLSETDFFEKYVALERRRLRELIQRFIELELSRPPFEVIAWEVKHEVILSGLPLTLRIDRIDRLLHSEEEILIDYKTGKTQLTDWFGDRPIDPQLPLYCIARKPKARGAAFAIIRPECVKYQGLSALEDCIEGVKTPEKMMRYGSEETWESQCLVWEQRLEELALEFSTGRVEVHPLEGEKTCRGCDYKSFCRVNESIKA